jgi:hypothetical protein
MRHSDNQLTMATFTDHDLPGMAVSVAFSLTNINSRHPSAAVVLVMVTGHNFGEEQTVQQTG